MSGIAPSAWFLHGVGRLADEGAEPLATDTAPVTAADPVVMSINLGDAAGTWVIIVAYLYVYIHMYIFLYIHMKTMTDLKIYCSIYPMVSSVNCFLTFDIYI